MRRFLLACVFAVLSAAALQAQTSLTGKVTDVETGEPIIFGTVALYRNDVLLGGTETDVDGNYNFPDIDPGTYDVEASYSGYIPNRITGVRVLAGRVNRVDITIGNDGGILFDEVVITEYKVPLIEQDNTTSGAVLTSDQIKNLPSRNINALAATSAGLATTDEGDAINIRGSRSTSTDYYVDGIRVTGSLVPDSEIEQLQVITGGVEAQYGDVTGGIISITTKGPANTFRGGIEMESSNFLDPYNWNLIGFNFSGPILRNKRGQSVLGFRLAGRYQDRLDDDPPAVPIYRVNDETLAELENQPIVELGQDLLVAADFTNNENVNVLDYRPFEESSSLNLNAKLDARLTDAIDVTLTGIYTDSKNRFSPGSSWRVFNSHNNPYALGSTARANFRLRHRLGGGNSGRESIIQNASYTLQFGYERTEGESYDHRHEFNYFDYGYVGNFDIEWVPTFIQQFDPATQQFYFQHTDYRQVLRGYEAGTRNPVLANYNRALGLTPGEAINGQVGEFIITDRADGRPLNTGVPGLGRQSFIAPNGAISPVFNNSWGFHTNVGWVYNSAGYSENDVYTFNGRANFDIVPTTSNRGRHNIQFGIIYEQRINRSYNVAPRGLWDVARLNANNTHIQGIEPGADTVGYLTITEVINGQPVDLQVPLLDLTITENSDNRFYRAIREELGLPLDRFVNVDGLDPDQLRMDMFSAKELNDQGIIGYFGYDYLGQPFNGSFDDFFTAEDADGVRTFPVAPNRPIYTAAYIQDKFTFRDIIFRLGVRVDRYDANTKVLRDPYSLYDIMGAKEFHDNFGGRRPGNIGPEYKVYLNDAGSEVTAYRSGDQWFRANGTPVNSPIELFSGGLVFPKYRSEAAQDNPTYIKSRDFNSDDSFRDYEAAVNVMPRLAFSFPISEDANFFANYDILVQRPATNTLATARDYFYFTDNPGAIKNNPDLRPERTINYEVGFQQKLSNTSKFKVLAYYKELRDMIQVRTFFPVPLIGQYTTYDNLDFGTVKAFSFEYDLRRTGNVSLNANYTLQFADGTGSDANSQRGLTNRGNLRNLFPLNFDERHRFNVNMDFRYLSGRYYTGPRLFGSDVLANFGVNLQAIAVSGRPYTATLTPLELGGAQFEGSINGARKPWTFTVNLQVDKTFQLNEKLGLNVYCRVSNLLDRRNVINVYSASGSPSDDGFLASPNGQDKIDQIQSSVRLVDAYLASYQWTILNPNFFSLPRRIFMGAIIDF